MARPIKYEIDPEEVEKLASIGATNVEIASFFGCDPSLISKNFSSIITKARESGKIRLRQWQMRAAQNGSVPMLIWLGKNMLNQSDQVSTTIIDVPPTIEEVQKLIVETGINLN
tara:strand:+ start:1457 stop:1798 length:342 start_codon:yes stop_codon:yes gene_type:complete